MALELRKFSGVLNGVPLFEGVNGVMSREIAFSTVKPSALLIFELFNFLYGSWYQPYTAGPKGRDGLARLVKSINEQNILKIIEPRKLALGDQQFLEFLLSLRHWQAGHLYCENLQEFEPFSALGFDEEYWKILVTLQNPKWLLMASYIWTASNEYGFRAADASHLDYRSIGRIAEEKVQDELGFFSPTLILKDIRQKRVASPDAILIFGMWVLAGLTKLASEIDDTTVGLWQKNVRSWVFREVGNNHFFVLEVLDLSQTKLWDAYGFFISACQLLDKYEIGTISGPLEANPNPLGRSR